MKIETQVYQLEYLTPKKSYPLSRRFADFVTLHKMIKKQYPGYILYPFPEHTLETFTKLKLSLSS
jgi:hypothetical protein